MDFSEKVRKARVEAGLSQTELAEKMGTSLRSICSYETGERKPRPGTLEKLAKCLGVSTTYLNDPECTDRYEGIDRDPYISEARRRYGSTGARDIDELLSENQAVFAGGELSENQKDRFFKAISDAYFAAKEEASRRYGRKER